MRCNILLVLMVFLGTFVSGPSMAHDHDPPRIMVAEVMKRLTNGEQIVFLDTRTNLAYDSIKSRIPNAIPIENGDILNRVIRETPKDQLVVTYCT